MTNERPRRKAIPRAVKRAVWDRQHGRCAHCGEPMEEMAGLYCQFDHRPSLRLREVNAEGTDYIPAQHDPDFIRGLHPRCHLEVTTGRRRDAERTVTTRGSDAWLHKRERQRLKPKKHKPKIPSRPFPKGQRKLKGRPWPTKT